VRSGFINTYPDHNVPARLPIAVSDYLPSLGAGAGITQEYGVGFAVSAEDA
jgi:hypothetical protein